MFAQALAARPVQALLTLTLLGAPALAQVEDTLDFDHARHLRTSASRSVLRSSVGLAERDGVLLAGGPDYKAAFTEDGVTYTPALGAAAPRNLPLGLRLVSVERGGEPVLDFECSVPPIAEELAVRYDRGTLQERYEVCADGILQSFVFPEPLAGSGDLVVRLALDTELVRTGATEDGGATLERDDLGGVRIGGVTGIDARDARTPGALRLEGGDLLLSLPAAFVDRASYPLVLDPLIGTVIGASGSSAYADSNPEVAYDHSSTNFVVVWSRSFSLTDADIRGQRLDFDGDYVGGLMLIRSTDVVSTNPAVASVNDTDRMLVAWEESAWISPRQIVCCTVDPATGSASGVLTVAPSAASQSDPDVGGERGFEDDDAMVVWSESGAGIRARQVDTPSFGSPAAVGSTIAVADDTATTFLVNPSITRCAGDYGYFGVAWQSEVQSNGKGSIYVRVLTRNGLFASDAEPISFAPFFDYDDQEPDIDGNGREFLVAWHRQESTTSTSTDVYARSFQRDDFGFELRAMQAIEDDAGDGEFDATVCWTGDQAFVAFSDYQGSNGVVFAKTVDPYTCLVCGTETSVPDNGEHQGDSAAASFWSGGVDTGGRALVVWESFDAADSDSDIDTNLVDTLDGAIELGGECFGGEMLAPCPFGGYDQFRVRAHYADEWNQPAYLLVGWSPQPIFCGQCTLWPSLQDALILPAGLNVEGEISYLLPLPEQASGKSIYAQFLFLTETFCSTIPVDLSSALRIDIQ